MKRNHTLLAFCGSIILGTTLIYGCGDDDISTGASSGTPAVDSGKTDTGTSSTSSSSSSSSSSGSTEAGVDAGPPSPPALTGKQLDRVGRPVINTAFNGTFEPDASTAGLAKDEYNSNPDRSAWVSKYRERIAGALAIYDTVDSTDTVPGCGDQPFTDASVGNQSPVSRYGTLAGLLADDRQWMNTGSTANDQDQYLHVEFNAKGLLPNTNVGGRKLTSDVIDRTYGVVSGLGPTADGLSDNVGRVTAKTDGATFPYLAAPP